MFAFGLISTSTKWEMKGRPREEIRRNARTPALLPSRRNSHGNSWRRNSPRYARQKSSARGQTEKNAIASPASRPHSFLSANHFLWLPFIFFLIFSFIPTRSRRTRINPIRAGSLSSLTLSLSLASHSLRVSLSMVHLFSFMIYLTPEYMHFLDVNQFWEFHISNH